MVSTVLAALRRRARPRALVVADAGAEIIAPFHGEVTVLVEPGDTVGAGQVVAVVEAMKLEARITAPGTGVVVGVVPAGPVDGGDVVVVLGWRRGEGQETAKVK